MLNSFLKYILIFDINWLKKVVLIINLYIRQLFWHDHIK